MRNGPAFLAALLALATAVHGASAREPASAPVSLSLDLAVRMAVERAPILRERLAAYGIAEAASEEAASALYPHVGATALFTDGSEGMPGLGPGGSYATPFKRQAEVELDQVLWDFGRTLHALRAAHADEGAAREALDASRAALVFDVEKAYVGAYYADQLVALGDAVVGERAETAAQADALFRAGLRSSADRDLARAQLSAAQAGAARLREEQSLARAALGEAVAQPGVMSALLTPPPAAPTGLPAVEEMVARALAGRPEIREGQRLVEAAEERLAGAHDEYAPRLDATLGAGYGQLRPPGQGDRPFVGGGVALSVPIFTGGAVDAHVRRRRADVDLAAAALDAEKLLVESEVRSWYGQVDAAAHTVEADAAAATAADAALAVARASYRAGLESLVELSQAEEAADTARERELRDQRDYLQARAGLRWVAAQPTP